MSWALYRQLPHQGEFIHQSLSVNRIHDIHNIYVDFVPGDELSLDLFNMYGQLLGTVPKYTPCFLGTLKHPLTNALEDGYIWLLRAEDKQLKLCRVELCTKEITQIGGVYIYLTTTDKLGAQINMAKNFYIYGTADVCRAPLWTSNNDYIQFCAQNGITPPLGKPSVHPKASPEVLAKFGCSIDQDGKIQCMHSWNTLIWIIVMLIIILFIIGIIVWLKLSQRYTNHIQQAAESIPQLNNT